MNLFVVVFVKMYFLCKKKKQNHIMLREHQHQNNNAV